MNVSVGRIVHYRLPRDYGDDCWRAATVVQVFGGDTVHCNLTVHFDALNDLREDSRRLALVAQGVALPKEPELGIVFSGAVGSAKEGELPGNWCWPPQVS